MNRAGFGSDRLCVAEQPRPGRPGRQTLHDLQRQHHHVGGAVAPGCLGLAGVRHNLAINDRLVLWGGTPTVLPTWFTAILEHNTSCVVVSPDREIVESIASRFLLIQDQRWVEIAHPAGSIARSPPRLMCRDVYPWECWPCTRGP